MPRDVAEALVLMVSPFAPHLGEELWRRLGHDETVAYVPFPVADPALLVDDTVEYPVQVNGKVRSHITVPADADAATPSEAAALADTRVAAADRRGDAEEGHRRPRPDGQRRRLTRCGDVTRRRCFGRPRRTSRRWPWVCARTCRSRHGQPEPPAVAVCPLEVVEQAPDEVPLDGHALGDRVVDGAEVAGGGSRSRSSSATRPRGVGDVVHRRTVLRDEVAGEPVRAVEPLEDRP